MNYLPDRLPTAKEIREFDRAATRWLAAREGRNGAHPWVNSARSHYRYTASKRAMEESR